MLSLSARRLCSRLVLLIVLIAGQILTPALATACDIGDALAQAGDSAAVVDRTADAAAPAVGDCCDGGNCVDCCLHASPVLTAAPRLPSIAFAAVHHDLHTALVAPSDYPVDVRPPIAA